MGDELGVSRKRGRCRKGRGEREWREAHCRRWDRCRVSWDKMRGSKVAQWAEDVGPQNGDNAIM